MAVLEERKAVGVGSTTAICNAWLILLEYRERTRGFDVFGIYQPRNFSLTAPGASWLI